MTRDEFSIPVKTALSQRVAGRCSNWSCHAATWGPHDEPGRSVNIGVAAHITAAAQGGPRYNASLTPEERRSANNGIWLCQSCAKKIDSDVVTYPVALLQMWKEDAEAEAQQKIGERPAEGTIVNAAVYIEGTGAIQISGPNAVHLGPNAITIVGPIIHKHR